MKKIIILSGLVLCGVLAVGCGKKEEKKVEMAKKVVKSAPAPTQASAAQQLSPIVIGQKGENSVEVQLKNCTGFDMTGFVIKNIKEKKYSPNLLLNNQKIKNNQIAQIFYTPNKDNMEGDSSDGAIMPIYVAEITLSNGKTFTLYSIGVNDIKDIAKIYYDPEDDIGFLVYVSKKTNSSISTKEMEKSAKKAGGVKIGNDNTNLPELNDSSNSNQSDYDNQQQNDGQGNQGDNEDDGQEQPQQQDTDNQDDQDQGGQDQGQDNGAGEDTDGDQPVINEE